MANRLSKETSPYLLQHANNPVDWYPWGPESLQKARRENKLILVSIGYSACHWCHVMEHETFEDKDVAEIMNTFFVCIKVDREERPDIDQIYMLAVQLMTGRGGWPLNCICLPDQRPIYGGTYFRKDDWKNLLLNLASFWKDKPDEAREYAERLTKGIDETEKLNLSDAELTYSVKDLEEILSPWRKTFDMTEGGHNRAPKFPMPNNWQFILRYAHFLKDKEAEVIAKLTLKKMAYGGIYDQIGGGFARYSVDGRWHVPHFEKMLYDNAQLLSLYSEAFQKFREPLYKEVVYETVEWLKREMISPEGGFYSALDADSEGVEGKFYTFTKAEIQQIADTDAQLFCVYYNLTDEGNWEEEKTNVLMRSEDDDFLAEEIGIPVSELKEAVKSVRQKVFEYREKRVRPGLDNKILASWNGLMIKGLTDAYRAFNEREFLDLAIANGNFILARMKASDGSLRRVYSSSGTRPQESAFLDDYAFVIDGFIGLYEATFNEAWLNESRLLCDLVLKDFYDSGTGMLFYTSQTGEQLISRKHEILDNVIPSSNSAMALNLYKLGHFFDFEPYLQQARQMLKNVFPMIKSYGSAYSNWAVLLMHEIYGLNEIAITGPLSEEKRKEIEAYFVPNKIILGGIEGTLPLLTSKSGSETKIFVCKNKTCQLPVTAAEEAIKQV